MMGWTVRTSYIRLVQDVSGFGVHAGLSGGSIHLAHWYGESPMVESIYGDVLLANYEYERISPLEALAEAADG